MTHQVMTWTVLGCGSSSGTPVIGCTCAVCVGGKQENIRSRCSAHVQIGDDCSIIIDTGPDFRQQALREQIERVDAVLYTHPHADHLNGIDDLRAFCFKQKTQIPIYGNVFSIENITQRFDYAFGAINQFWNRPVLKAHAQEVGLFDVLGVAVEMFNVPHGRWQCSAYRIGNVAWLTDLNFLSDEVIAGLQGLDYLFLDCLMEHSYPSHLSVEQAFEYAKRINAKQTYLIHMTHSLDYDELSTKCPDKVAVAYDGLQVEIEYKKA